MGGGRIVVRPPDDDAGAPVLIGNTALYGATRGELFCAGRAGEGLAVRNSGATGGGGGGAGRGRSGRGQALLPRRGGGVVRGPQLGRHRGRRGRRRPRRRVHDRRVGDRPWAGAAEPRGRGGRG